MAERATVLQTTQVGVETTPGTLVPANRRLQAMQFEPAVQLNVAQFRAIGLKFPAVAAGGREWVQAGISGQATYTELIYAFLSALKKTTPVLQPGGSQLWTFEPDVDGPDVFDTFTVEQGDGRAHRFGHGMITEFGITFTRDEVTLEGTALGQRIEDGITKTATPAEVGLVPILGGDVSVYIDPTFGALGTTKMLRVLEVSWKISDRYGPLWVLDRDQDSFVAAVELAPTVEIGLALEADANGMALLGNARAGDTRFIRIDAESSVEAAAGEVHRLRIDTAAKVVEVGSWEDNEGVFQIDYTLNGFYDSGWGKAISASLRNDVAAA